MLKSGNKPFSLIELLLVIAVMEILLSLLLPSLSRARHKAMISVCMSNQAQVYRGLVAFAKDNNSYLPKSRVFKHGEWVTKYGKNGKSATLGHLVDKELISPEVLYCPMWNHPVARFNMKSKDKRHGGFHSDPNDDPTSLIWTSLAYRHYPDLGKSKRSPNLMLDDNNIAITADHWTKRKNNDYGWDQGNGAFGHLDGISYVTSYIDGTNKLIYDKSRALLTISIIHTAHKTIENAWEKYFDKD